MRQNEQTDQTDKGPQDDEKQSPDIKQNYGGNL